MKAANAHISLQPSGSADAELPQTLGQYQPDQTDDEESLVQNQQ